MEKEKGFKGFSKDEILKDNDDLKAIYKLARKLYKGKQLMNFNFEIRKTFFKHGASKITRNFLRYCQSGNKSGCMKIGPSTISQIKLEPPNKVDDNYQIRDQIKLKQELENTGTEISLRTSVSSQSESEKQAEFMGQIKLIPQISGQRPSNKIKNQIELEDRDSYRSSHCLSPNIPLGTYNPVEFQKKLQKLQKKFIIFRPRKRVLKSR